MKKTSYSLVKDILPDVFENLSRQSVNDQIRLEKRWKEIIGGEADKAVVVGCKDGCLFVNVDCGARLFQMRVRKARLLTALRESEQGITNIVFKIGKVK